MPSTNALPVDGWLRRDAFLEKHPQLRTIIPNTTSFDWTVRVNRARLAPYLRRCGREVLIHDQAADILPDLMLKPIV